MNVDEMFGGNAALDCLIKECKKYNIRIILDGVFNHTGDDSIYFNKYSRYDSVGAYQSKDSIYYNWFSFVDYPEEYESWWGIDTLPQTNEQDYSFQEFITGKDGVVRHWLKKGVAGFRLDVVDELPNFFVKKIKSAQNAVFKDNILIGEVWEDASSKIAYHERKKYFLGSSLDSVMNYPLKNGIIEFVKHSNSSALSSAINMILDHYPKDVVDCLMNITGTHDTARMLTAVSTDTVFYNKEDKAKFVLSDAEYKNGLKKVKLAALLQFTLPGVPCVYYADETGMQGFEDPFNRKTYPWGTENKELLSWYRWLGDFRKNKIFKDGQYNEIYSNDGVFVFERILKRKSVIIAVNSGAKTFNLKSKRKFKCILGNEDLILKPYGFCVLV